MVREVLDEARDKSVRVLALLGLAVLPLVAGAAAVVHPLVGVAVAALPLLLLLLIRPAWLATAAVALSPFNVDLTGGALGGLQIALSDLALLLALAGFLLLVVQAEVVSDRWRYLKPFLATMAPYLLALVVLLAAHTTFASVANTLQRVELVVVPVIAAGVLMDRRGLVLALRGFVLLSLVLTVGFCLQFGALDDTAFGINKNPGGQFIANAIILLLGSPGFSQRWRLLALPPLVVGVIAAQSRGAVVALIVSLAVLLLLRGQLPRMQVLGVVSAAAIVAVFAFQALPTSSRDRVLNTRSGGDYALDIRESYREDALALWRDHPVAGVGVGQYLAGNVEDGTISTDPHNVLLLELAEGGVVLLVGFLVLAAAPVGLVLVRRRGSDLVPVAVAVQVGVLVHGLVDTYWVRGTPILGFALLAAAYAFAPGRDRAG